MHVPKLVENGQNSAIVFENKPAKKAWKLGKFKLFSKPKKRKTIFSHTS
jgi:hypothetical protein